MGRKMSIHAGDSTLELIDLVKDFRQIKGMNSRAINMASDHYLAILKNSTPSLVENEWMAIISSYTGHKFSKSIEQECRFLPLKVQDAIEFEGVGVKFNVTEEDFISKLRNFGFAEKLSIIHVIRRWYSMTDPFESNLDQLIAAAGTEIQEDVRYRYPINEVKKIIDDFNNGKISIYSIHGELQDGTGPELIKHASDTDYKNKSLRWHESSCIKDVPVTIYYCTTPEDQQLIYDDNDDFEWSERIERVELSADLEWLMDLPAE